MKDQMELSEAITAESLRLFDLPNESLGAELANMAREIQVAWPNVYPVNVAASLLVERIVPELALRLGSTGEDTGLASLTNIQFRELLSETLRRQFIPAEFGSYRRKPDTAPKPLPPGSDGWKAVCLLRRAVSLGNPIAFAIERLAPPPVGWPDWIANQVQDAARQKGYRPTQAWGPQLLGPSPKLSSQAAIDSHIGKVISSISLQASPDACRRGLSETLKDVAHIVFDDNTALDLLNGATYAGQNTVSCDDDLAFYSGSVFLGAEIKAGGTQHLPGEDAAGNARSISFLEVATTDGTFSVTTHQLHNGHYGDFELDAMTVEPRPEPGAGMRPG